MSGATEAGYRPFQYVATWPLSCRRTLGGMTSDSNRAAGFTVEFEGTFGTGSRASRCSQFLPFRDFDITGQDVTRVIELEDVWRVRRTSRVTLAFGTFDDDAHGAASIV
ncbi:hypothetical protein MPL1032_220028 [Mesorhizobium plurifarium]|uniref:Uncharacterized protein n=1 Tax=Mesorhizobium plurifarium TaxID=69974 RepID=A0A0K2VYR8_MESPL|nr:hypothetical protein MPL1032_220028 [Mesorhizobium plurifarium]